ncbi:MAG: hypothetical protein AABX38_04905 [Candidatus Micrarchaeota archaeon]
MGIVSYQTVGYGMMLAGGIGVLSTFAPSTFVPSIAPQSAVFIGSIGIAGVGGMLTVLGGKF